MFSVHSTLETSDILLFETCGVEKGIYWKRAVFFIELTSSLPDVTAKTAVCPSAKPLLTLMSAVIIMIPLAMPHSALCC